MWEYNAKIRRVVDADTLEILIDLGFRIYHMVHIRILDLDSPEKQSPEGLTAIMYAETLIDGKGDGVVVRTKYDRSFTRYLGDVFFSDQTSFAEAMKAAGHGR